METKIKKYSEVASKNNQKTKRIFKFRFLSLFLFSILFLSPQVTFAHCDSYDGPVIKDALKALETNNVKLVLIWVDKDQEESINSIFTKTYNLKSGDKEIYAIVEKYFLETLVRLHRESEGAPYTGLKPAGSASKIVQMADKSIATGSVEDLAIKFTAHIENVVREKYEKVTKLYKIKNESLEKGRAYVAAYVDYTHTLEGIHSILEHSGSAHSGH